MLAMPIFAEQNHNAHMVLKYGIGIALSKVVKINYFFKASF